jgi:hypothetical protein
MMNRQGRFPTLRARAVAASGKRLMFHATMWFSLLTLLALVAAGKVSANQEKSGSQDSVCENIDTYDCYTNHKYGYLLAWPKKLLVAQGESQAGDGQVFQGSDGRARLTCWAGFNDVQRKSLWSMFQEAQNEADLKVTYKHMGKNFFVVSGFDGDDIFYRKTIRDENITATFVLAYDKSLKAAFDPIAKDIGKSFFASPEFTYR